LTRLSNNNNNNNISINNNSSNSNNNNNEGKSVFSDIFDLLNGQSFNVNLVISVANNGGCQMLKRTKEIEKLDSNFKPEPPLSTCAKVKSNLAEMFDENKGSSSNKIISVSFQKSQSPVWSRKENSIVPLRDADADSTFAESGAAKKDRTKKDRTVKTPTRDEDSSPLVETSKSDGVDTAVDRNCSTFRCGRCLSTFPMSNDDDVGKVCSHVAVGVAGSCSTNLSTFFRHFRFRVKLIVKPRVLPTHCVDQICRTEVSTITAVSCSRCPDVEFDIDQVSIL
jgi:hypothetical protein